MRAESTFPEYTERLEAGGGMAIRGCAVAACLANARAAAGVAVRCPRRMRSIRSTHSRFAMQRRACGNARRSRDPVAIR
ncbi:hypothetical protein WG70_08975 [Burkholderia oklahomensis EO147]|nr:hypothetical protein WG70_08975 [Burkholderia oklahomensis EO147]KUY67714.1 hypothetical protein WG70_26090 [Burkholderia oklahomensis EO147]